MCDYLQYVKYECKKRQKEQTKGHKILEIKKSCRLTRQLFLW